jgi:hypothetical protein
MPRNKVQGVQHSEMAIKIPARQHQTPLSVVFCGQVLAFQYFGQINPDRPAPKLFKTEILQNRSVFFLSPDSRRRMPTFANDPHPPQE